MASGRMHTVVRRLRQTALFDAGLADGELLERYLGGRDESAFAALVRRHGPMVLGVCRRILRDTHDAEDAFQATFLVLVRKAHSIIPRERVGPWLYGVAYRTSLKARAMSSRRRVKQKVLQDVPGPAPSAHEEWLDLLDREVNRLPDKYRLPIVLCDLQGKTRKQAARQLGWPEGTVATRLQQGRALVQKRLARHGLPLSGGAIMLVWAEAISAANVPARLLASTVQTASIFSAGTLAGAIPLKVIALAQGVLKAMVLTKVKNASAILILVGALGLGLGGLTSGSRPAAAAQPTADEPPANRLASPSETRNAAAQTSVVTFVDSGTAEHNTGRLPTGPAPVQALVSFDKGKVIVRTNQSFYEPRTAIDQSGGNAMTYYEVRHLLRADRYERDQVKVYDTRRRKLDNKDMPKWLKEEVPALVLVGSRELDPLHLRLIKDGTLIFVLPTIVGPPTSVYTSPPVMPVGTPSVASPVPALGPTPLAVPQYPVPSVNVPRSSGTATPPPLPASAAPAGDDVLVTHQRTIQLPIHVSEARRAELREIDLFVSSDQGKTWRHDSTIAPTHRAFSFTAPADGSYWFRVVAVHRSKKREPIISGPPDMRIVVDTSMPPPVSPPPESGQTATPRIDQAERELAIAEFYLKTGHRTSAVYYYELVQRRHAGTGYAKKAADLLRELQRQEQPPPPLEKAEARVGQIFIVGNTRVPDTTIREALDLFPGQVLDYKQVRATEEKLRGFKDLVNVSPIVNIRPTVTVLEAPDGSPYRDILVTVQESLRLDVLEELEKLSGTWTTIKSTVDGKDVPRLHDLELVFQGNRVTSKPSEISSGSRCSVTLDLATKPTRIRLTPLDGPAGAGFSAGTYEIAGDILKLALRTGSGPSTTGSMSPEMVLTLKRKTGELIPGTAETRTTSPPSVQDKPNPLITLDLTSKGLKITAATLEFVPGGHVKLTDATITRPRPGQPPQVLSGKRILITFDGPVRTLSDFVTRQMVRFDVDGVAKFTAVSPR